MRFFSAVFPRGDGEVSGAGATLDGSAHQPPPPTGENTRAGLRQRAEATGPRADPVEIPPELRRFGNQVADSLAFGLEKLSGNRGATTDEWPLRPWDEFFARFQPPDHLEERVRTNYHYYRANYLLVIIPSFCAAGLLFSVSGLGALFGGAGLAYWVHTEYERASDKTNHLVGPHSKTSVHSRCLYAAAPASNIPGIHVSLTPQARKSVL